MALFQTDGCIEKLTRVELKKHFHKMKIVRASYLPGPLTTAEIIKGFDINAPTLQNLIDKLQREEIIRYNDKNSDTPSGTVNVFPLFSKVREKGVRFWKTDKKIMSTIEI